MGGGKAQGTANDMLAQNAGRANNQYTNFQNQNTGLAGDTYNKSNDVYGKLTSGLTSIGGAPGIAPLAPGAGPSGARSTDATGTYKDFMSGAASAPNSAINSAASGYGNFMNTGGVDPTRAQAIDQSAGGLQSIGMQGASNPGSLNRLRGGGVYDEFAKTGGYAPNDIAEMRARGNSGVPQFFSDLKNRANQTAAIQGGYGPAQAAIMGRFGRAQAGAAQDARLNTDLGIKSAINTNRLAGASGMAGTEGGVVGNQLSGLTGSAGVQQGLINTLQSGQEFGTSGLNSLGQAQRQADMSGRLAGASGTTGLAQADQQQQNWADELRNQQQQFSAGGLNSLYGTTSGNYNTMSGQNLSSIGAQDQGNIAGAGTLKSGNKNWWDSLAPMMGGGAGILTGISSFGRNGAS